MLYFRIFIFNEGTLYSEPLRHYVVTFNIKTLEGNIDMFVNHYSNNKYAFL